ncbi:MAG: hypothetical protein IPI46_08920 [Bacteroidetes bacterium]|nr:hypothetical protein [Bacteroidota bacterium]
MKSTSETGHAINVANFNELITAVTALGATYAPAKASLKLASLNAISTAGANSLNEVISKKNAYNNAVNARMQSFSKMRPLATRVLAALHTTDANFELLKDAKTINRKIQGRRAVDIAPVAEGAAAPKSISASQLSYDQLIQHFTTLVNLIETVPSYQPAENDLKLDTQQTYISELNSLNSQVSAAYIAIGNERIARNTILYKTLVGLVDIALSVKLYVKSVFGSNSPQYKGINKIAFRTIA